MEVALLAPWRLATPLAAFCTASLPCLGSRIQHLVLHGASLQQQQSLHSTPSAAYSAATYRPRAALLHAQHAATQPLLGWPLAVRHLQTQSSNAPPVPPSVKVQTAIDVLQQVHMLRLREELELEAERRLHIPYSRFVELTKSCGVASTDEEAAEACRVLQTAGVLLKQQGIVYLRVDEVADMLLLLLPGGRQDAQEKLAGVEAELAELDKTHTQVEKSSHRLADALLWAGFLVLCTQFVAFIYLTWWELSWDVMEPIAYIISLFYSIVAYVYFFATRHAFDLGPIQHYWSQQFKSKRIAKLQFDAERYAYLRKLQERYRRHLSHTHIDELPAP